ncbi:iron-sulfur cluster insertion protein ErpA, partial [Brevibacterium paucivorans]
MTVTEQASHGVDLSSAAADKVRSLL